MTKDFEYIFKEAKKNYTTHGNRLENFRDIKNNPMIYNFMINNGEIDKESLNLSKELNEELHSKFINQKQKTMIGYKGIENIYRPIDDLDSKHILILNILFSSNNNFKNIIEIGGGYGNFLRLSDNIIEYNSWEIIDLLHVLELQKYFLSNEIENTSKISFTDCHLTLPDYSNKKTDLVIGTHSLSEISMENFINYIKKVVIYSKYLFLGYNKLCPSSKIIQSKLNYLFENNFETISIYDYREKTGANVSYTMFKNNNF
jgi:hypothetical protein